MWSIGDVGRERWIPTEARVLDSLELEFQVEISQHGCWKHIKTYKKKQMQKTNLKRYNFYFSKRVLREVLCRARESYSQKLEIVKQRL